MISSTSALDPPCAASAAGALAPADFSDWELEQRIDFQAGLIAMAHSLAEKMAACKELARLHEMRSPEQIERMERARGLR